MQTPEFVLLSATTDNENGGGHWRFVLRALEGGDTLEAADDELDVHGDRLALLAVIRGLEALEQPSKVRVVTSSRYVRRGISFGLASWRKNGWTWESYGVMAPIKNQDLWLRVDRVMQIHEVCCSDVRRAIRLDSAHETVRRPRMSQRKANGQTHCRDKQEHAAPRPTLSQTAKNRKENQTPATVTRPRRSSNSQLWQLSFA